MSCCTAHHLHKKLILTCPSYKLVAIKLMTASKEHLEKHYEDLSDKPFFKGLVACPYPPHPSPTTTPLTPSFLDMGSGPVCAMVWEGKDVVKTGRTLLGATNPLASPIGMLSIPLSSSAQDRSLNITFFLRLHSWRLCPCCWPQHHPRL